MPILVCKSGQEQGAYHRPVQPGWPAGPRRSNDLETREIGTPGHWPINIADRCGARFGHSGMIGGFGLFERADAARRTANDSHGPLASLHTKTLSRSEYAAGSRPRYSQAPLNSDTIRVCPGALRRASGRPGLGAVSKVRILPPHQVARARANELAPRTLRVWPSFRRAGYYATDRFGEIKLSR